MKGLIFLSIIFLVNGSPLQPTPPPPPGIELLDFLLLLKAAADKLDAFPWIKASKAKARFGPTTHAPATTPSSKENEQEVQPMLTQEMLQNYIATLTAQLQPFVIKDEVQTSQGPVLAPQPMVNIPPPLPPKKILKAKVPKQIKLNDMPQTTPVYWIEEKTLYPDSLYDEYYMDWLRKRQIEEIPVATPMPVEDEESGAPPPPPPQSQPYPTMAMSPYYANPFLYPFAGIKMSKAMAQAQVNSYLAAMNITTTQKPVKIKLKISVPAGDDLASVVANGIAGFPTGTTYELSRKK